MYLDYVFIFFFFFFQAEDGIRDVAVTGVQTCALPIYSGSSRPRERVPWPPARPAPHATRRARRTAGAPGSRVRRRDGRSSPGVRARGGPVGARPARRRGWGIGPSEATRACAKKTPERASDTA